MKLVTTKELQKDFLREPGYKEAYDELALEFRLIDELIRARAEKGITQEVLAKKIGTKQSAIARFESGRGNPTLDFIQRLSKGLGLKLQITVQ